MLNELITHIKFSWLKVWSTYKNRLQTYCREFVIQSKLAGELLHLCDNI